MTDIEQPTEHRRRTYQQTHPCTGRAAFLSRFPEQRRNRTHNQSDKQPHRHRSGLIQTDGNSLGKGHKSHTPACNQRRNPSPVLRDRTSGVGQNFHHGLIDIKHHRQHTGGNAGQNCAGPQKDSAQSIPQPSYHQILILRFSHVLAFLLAFSKHDSSFASHLQSNTLHFPKKIGVSRKASVFL